MYYVYVLRSLRNNKRYIGYTSKQPEIRLKEHNNGANFYTRKNRPFVLLHTERYDSLKEAIRRERFLKTGQGRRFLDKRIPP